MNSNAASTTVRSPSRGLPLHTKARWQIWAAVAVVIVAAASSWSAPAWVRMWALAAGEFLALKLLTLRETASSATPWKITAYVALWPGMDASAFLNGRVARADRPATRELVAAAAKLALGLGLATWAAVHAADEDPLLIGWMGMGGIILTLHFGFLHVLSWAWRRSGVPAPPIMRAPLAATSLAELWGERWNLAFADSARRLLLRPLARRVGARGAGAFVFLVSGLVHETVISLPARGGWGGPTLYFLLQAAGVGIEKSGAGKRFGLARGPRGWCWTFAFAAVPLPLLFHAPFVRNVIVPFYRTSSAFVP
jgi:hypothetical protein